MSSAGLLVVGLFASIALLAREARASAHRRRAGGRLGIDRGAAASIVPATRWACDLSTRAVERLRRLATARRYERALPVALEALARALRAGTPLASALRAAAYSVEGEVGHDLGNAASGLDQGVASSTVLAQWLSHRPLPGVRLAVAALIAGTELGGSRARAVDRVAAGLRDRAAAAREVQAWSSQARLSALVIAVAPVVFALLGLSGNRDMAAFLFLSPAGWICLAGGAALDAAAAWWMTGIVRRAAA